MKAADKLRANWSKREQDIMLHFPLGSGTKSDAALLAHTFNRQFTDDLASRGYDIRTLKFSIEPMAGDTRFASQRSAP